MIILCNNIFLKIVIFKFKTNMRYCGVKELDNPGSLRTKPKAHAEEEETFEDNVKKSGSPRRTVEDNYVLGQPRPEEGESTPHQRQPPRAPQEKEQV